jgi:hypothetical protein
LSITSNNYGNKFDNIFRKQKADQGQAKAKPAAKKAADLGQIFGNKKTTSALDDIKGRISELSKGDVEELRKWLS